MVIFIKIKNGRMIFIKEKTTKIVKEILWMNTKADRLKNLTLSNLEKKMKEKNFDDNLIIDLIEVWKQRIIKLGEKDFQLWLYNLDFKTPDEFLEESFAIKFYEKYHTWIEKEIVKLEKETKISWEIQSEDLKKFTTKARKVQLVIRHRVSEIVLALMD